MKKSAKRLLALILAMAMALSLLSASVWAAEEDPASSAPAEVEVQEEPQKEEAPEDEPEPEEKADESDPEAQEEEVPEDESAPEEEPEAKPQEEEEPEAEPQEEEDQVVDDKCGETLTWEVKNNTLTIEGTGAMYDFVDDDELYNQEVRHVRPWHDYDVRNGIRKVVIKDGVTSIGTNAFRDMDALRVVEIPSSVTSIGADAFYDCDGIYSIALPTGVTIGENAFYSCSNLTKVTNGESKVDAFKPSPWWRVQKFATATEMKDGETKDFTVKGTGEQYVFIKYAPTKNTRIGLREVADSQKNVYDLYWGRPYLADGTRMDDDPDVFYAGEVYYYQISMWINDPDKDGSFQLTTAEEEKLTEGKFANEAGEEDALSWKFADGTLTVSGKGVVGTCPWGRYYDSDDITALVVEDGVTGWDTPWFEDSSYLATVTLAPSVKEELCENSFACCSKLATVTLTEDNFTLATIAKAFYKTPWLAAKKYKDAKELKVGESATVEVTDVSKMAVFKFVAPEDGTYVVTAEAGTYAYPWVGINSADKMGYYTDGELGIAEANPDPDDKDEASRELEKDELVYVTAGGELPGKFSITLTKQDKYSGKCGEDATWKLEDGVLTVSGKGGMDSHPWDSMSKKIKKVVIEEGITSIDDSAFSGCEELTEVSLPSTLRTIGNGAFSGCKKLPSVKLNDGLAEIGRYAFEGCEELSDVNIPEGVKSIGYCAFYGCPKLKKVFVPESVDEIGKKAFGFYTDDEGKQDQKVEGFTLYGKAGSEAEKYAKEAEIPFNAHEAHTYTATWTWAADNKSAEATLTCSECGLSEKVTTTNITSAYDAKTKKTTLTATAEFNGQTYTGTKVIEPNTITTADTVFFTYNAKKAQKKTLKVTVQDGAEVTFKSNSKKVKVNKAGKVTVSKKFKGKAKITVSVAGTNNYGANSKKVLIMVGPSATKLSSVKGAKKSFTAKWKKNKMAKAYKIQYSTKKDFSKKVKSVKVKGAKSVKTTVKKLKKGTYYVRLRTEDGSTYSKWSKVVKVKVK